MASEPYSSQIDCPARVTLFDRGDDSLQARLALIHGAKRQLDLQYYAINNDVTANLLVEALIRAARRGVKVRFLIDDVSLGKIYKSLSALDLYENITVRVFNPVSRDDQTIIARLLAFLSHLPRATRRMHNKVLLADETHAIIGGRNLGDEYFDPDAQTPFKDLDILIGGDVIPQIADSFEKFWASAHAVSISRLYSRKIGKLYRYTFERRLRRNWHKAVRRHGEDKIEPTLAALQRQADHQQISLLARFVSDPPEKIDGAATGGENPIDLLNSLIEQARWSIWIVSPYFVPGDEGMAALRSLRDRGIEIRIITNSLASTDVVAVHTGYRKYRQPLLEAGVELWEMKPAGRKRPRQRPLGKGSPSFASLHAKAYVIDGRWAVIGSLNLDPRSINLNTEAAFAAESAELSEQLERIFKETVEPENSYKVTAADGDLRWTTTDEGREIEFTREPRAGIWRRVQEFIIRFLPVEDQL